MGLTFNILTVAIQRFFQLSHGSCSAVIVHCVSGTLFLPTSLQHLLWSLSENV